MTTLDRSWRLHLDPASGRVSGTRTMAGVRYNSPWPCPNGRMGVTGTMRGVVQHTMASDLADCIAAFNDPGRHASAHFGVGQSGLIHQFGPIGKGWEAWHAFAANPEFYGIEFEDHHDPALPMSDHALTAGAQLIEFLSRFAGFGLWLMTRYTGQGLAYHRQFTPEWNWNYHSCPDASFDGGPRSAQRDELLRRARLIRG